MWKALKIEIKNTIFKTTFHFIRFGGLLLMPFIYAFSYVFAFYDPFSKTDQLPIALYVSQDENSSATKNNFGKALAKVLSNGNNVHIGELKTNLKMNPEDIYVDNDPQIFLNKLEEKSREEFAAIYLPNLGNTLISKDGKRHNGLDAIIKNAVSAVSGGTINKIKLTLAIIDYSNWIVQNELDEQHKIHIFNNKQKNYLIGLGIGIGKDMDSSSKFILDVLIKAAQDVDYLTSIGIQPNEIKPMQEALKDLNLHDQELLKIESQMGGENSKYGYGLAPFFINVSMWIGAMVLTFAIHRKIYDYKITAGKRYLAKWFLIATGIIIQSTLLMTSLYFIGFDQLGIKNWWTMFGFTIIIGLVYAAIVQGLRYSIHERNIGLFLIIILLVLQMASAGGLFPIDTQSSFYQILNKILPMGRGVNIIREATFETNWSNLFNNLGFLLIYLFIVPFAVYINTIRTIKIYLTKGIPLPKSMQTKLAFSTQKSFERKLDRKGRKNV